MAKLKTRQVNNLQQRKTFFDALAADYQDTHDNTGQLLQYRLSIIKNLMAREQGTLLEIGCGTGQHLLALAEQFDFCIGTDFSANMIASAEQQRKVHPGAEYIRFSVDPAEQLTTIQDASIAVVLCVGALEHMPEQELVMQQIHRVLQMRGCFICLTPNAGYCWYTVFSHWLAMDTRHLSSDKFLKARQLGSLANAAGLKVVKRGYWTFIPRGDMPNWTYRCLLLLDNIGKRVHLSIFRGGLFAKFSKP